MKKHSIIIAAAAALAACSNEAPDAAIAVSVPATGLRAGEPVTFTIDSEADNIIFYSGEPGHEYDLRDRDQADHDLLVDFVSYTDYTTDVHPNLQVLLSYDFDGLYEADHVEAAHWTDVTAEFTLPSVTGQNTPSGQASLGKYIPAGNNGLVYLAVRYLDLDGTPVRNRWVIRSMNISKVSPEGETTALADIKTAGWQNVALAGSMTWTLPGTQLLASGSTTTADKDAWAITSGFDLHTSTPSTGQVIKNTATRCDTFTYTYTEPGVYKAVFAASSEWYNSSSRAVTSVTVTITE